MRAYPSAAPVTTPSKRPSTQRISVARSSAATICISEVPGFVKQVFTPPANKVRMRLSAPFILLECAPTDRSSIPVLLLRRSFIEVARNYRGKVLEVSTQDSQVIARHRLHLKAFRQVRPNRSWIIWIIGHDLSPYKFDGALVEARTIARQSPVRVLARALHSRSMGRSSRYLAWCAAIS